MTERNLSRDRDSTAINTNDRRPQPITMPGIHEAVQKVVAGLPRGSLLDVGAGQGAFSLWAGQQGFAVTATDVDRDNFLVPTIPFQQTDLGSRWPFADGTFDLVVSIEVLEHVENHYHFLRECCRICKPGGRLVLSTPNCHSIESRLNYLLTGFDDCAPRPIDHENPQLGSIYMEHIHPAPLPTIELGLRACGYEIESIAFNRRRRLATVLLPIAYPFLWWRTYRQLILCEKNSRVRVRNRKLMRLFLHTGLLTGRISIFTCRRIVDPEEVKE
jgi:SAM-dependent methyltransferase